MRHAGPATDYLWQILNAQAQRQPRAAAFLDSQLNPKAAYRLQKTKADAIFSRPQAPNANFWKTHRSNSRMNHMGMPKAPFQPCIPTRARAVPAHSDWIHEVKQDGFRLILQRDGDRVRLFTRNGHNWTSCYPLILEAARRIRTKLCL